MALQENRRVWRQGFAMNAAMKSEVAFEVMMHQASNAWYRCIQYERSQVVNWLNELPVDNDGRICWSRDVLVESINARWRDILDERHD
jgi:hypothetical protein